MKMMMATQSSSVAALLVATLMLSTGCWAFPNGGPIDACVKQRANQPNHGSHQPQPEETNPFVIEASGENYQPGQVITVNVLGAETSYKGFFIQARDQRTNEWVGTFEIGPDVKSYPECSAATHTNKEPKDSTTLVWHAPEDQEGKVYFIGTVLQSYRTFWSDVVGLVQRGERNYERN